MVAQTLSNFVFPQLPQFRRFYKIAESTQLKVTTPHSSIIYVFTICGHNMVEGLVKTHFYSPLPGMQFSSQNKKALRTTSAVFKSIMANFQAAAVETPEVQ